MSEHQERERQRIEAAGGFYFVAKDMESFVSWFNETFDLVNNSEKTEKK